MSDQDKTLKKASWEKPGSLVGGVRLRVNTMEAQRLFSGRYGLFPFATRAYQLVQASLKDDPYADYYLLGVYDGLIQIQKFFKDRIKIYEEKIQHAFDKKQIEIETLISEKPVFKVLLFKTQYGYLAANAIAILDELFCILLTAHRLGVSLEKPFYTLRDNYHRKMRYLFKKIFKWKNLNLTRQLLCEDKIFASVAQEKMGDLPSVILKKEITVPFTENDFKK